jgi:hypothetical protein
VKQYRNIGPHEFANLHLIYRNYVWSELTPRKQLQCISHRSTPYTECAELTFLPPYYFTNYLCVSNRILPHHYCTSNFFLLFPKDYFSLLLEFCAGLLKGLHSPVMVYLLRFMTCFEFRTLRKSLSTCLTVRNYAVLIWRMLFLSCLKF